MTDTSLYSTHRRLVPLLWIPHSFLSSRCTVPLWLKKKIQKNDWKSCFLRRKLMSSSISPTCLPSSQSVGRSRKGCDLSDGWRRVELAPRGNENVVPHRSLWLLTSGSFLKVAAFFKLVASFFFFFSTDLFTQQRGRLCRVPLSHSLLFSGFNYPLNSFCRAMGWGRSMRAPQSWSQNIWTAPWWRPVV